MEIASPSVASFFFCWSVSVSIDPCWLVLVSVGQCWSTCWSVLVSVGQLVGQCWSVLVSVGQCCRTSELRRRLRLETIDVYIEQRKVRWAGHVARMGPERPPRKFLTAWVRHPRPHGRPQYTSGHSLNKTLVRAGITSDFEG